jgi:hypothetical protein
MVPHQLGHKAVDGASGSSEVLEKHPRNSVAYGSRKLQGNVELRLSRKCHAKSGKARQIANKT